MEKELYRVKEGRWICGVCKGMAEYMQMPVAFIRIIFILMVPFAFGGGILLYIASIFMIREKPDKTEPEEN